MLLFVFGWVSEEGHCLLGCILGPSRNQLMGEIIPPFRIGLCLLSSGTPDGLDGTTHRTWAGLSSSWGLGSSAGPPLIASTKASSVLYL